MSRRFDTVRPIFWEDETLKLVDQRRLPQTQVFLHLTTATEAFDAIRNMVVRGAPAIGITAAYGVVLSIQEHGHRDRPGLVDAVCRDIERLHQARPTAINLSWALKRLQKRLETEQWQGDIRQIALDEAMAIHRQDIEACYRMGDFGAGLIDGACGVLTHCNAGALATGGYGTALGVIRAAFDRGLVDRVYADETRPWFQGARLTAWELHQDGIPVSLLADGAGAWLMKQGKVQWMIVGSDRIAANGDVANKIGTYHAAIAAKHHGLKVMVAAPTSTIDLSVSDGAAIPIEQRAEEEVLSAGGTRVAAADVSAWNPVFDVTPAELVDAIVTERGVIRAPNAEKIAAMMAE